MTDMVAALKHSNMDPRHHPRPNSPTPGQSDHDWPSNVRLEDMRFRATGGIAAEIAGRLESSIQSGELPAGTRLPSERVLAEKMRVSRTTVRDALKLLELHRLVIRRRGTGTEVAPPDPRANQVIALLGGVERDLHDVAELRDMVEPSIAGVAAARASAADLDRMQDLLERSEGQLTAAGSLQCDLDYHLLLAQCSGNALLPPLLSFMNDATAKYRLDSHRTRHSRHVSLEGHRRIFRAVADHDQELAMDAMKAHLSQVAELTEKYRIEAATQALSTAETTQGRVM